MRRTGRTGNVARRVQAFVMAALLLMAFVLPDITPVKAEGELTLKLHYNRPDGAYDGWSVWMWPEGGEGADYALADENGEMVASFAVEPGTTSVGFIVRTQDWAKDVDADQFIDISEMVSGTVHIYVESGVEGYTKEYGDDAVTGTKLKAAVYNGDGTVSVTMTGSIEGDASAAFSMRGKESDVQISSVSEGVDFVYTVTLAAELDNAKSYWITYDGTEYSVNMPIIYSTPEFEEAYTYEGEDLGAVWSKDSTSFRVWAPTAEEMYLNLYESGSAGKDDLIEQLPMTADANGTWTVTKDGDLNGTYYTYTAVLDGLRQEACDPYARTTGVNGKRAMVIDLDSTDPEGWDKDEDPHAGAGINDAIIYELQVRDFATDESSGITNVGKFLSFTETGTTTAGGVPTGVDHLKDLGITHLHLLPVYDFGSVDETYTFENLYNWGYDPVNYNVPEGSYSTDPYNGEVRVAEMKQMVKSLHDNGISVVMDVVYNHVYSAGDFCFNKLVPGYFSRIKEDGSYSSGSGCGNDTASERSMVKKYIVESVCYWADEYHIDGFRFDLVGLLDTETVNAIVEEVHKDHPNVIFYGEGWTMETAVTKEGYKMATQQNSENTPGFAFFNDTIRDGLKGNVFNEGEVGYVSGATNQESLVESCFMGDATWCSSPSQTVNYAACHDNLTLFDRLQVSRPDASTEDLIKMNNLAAAVYMTAEGVPFIMAGEELLRSKPNGDGTFNSNSYASGDEINAIRWSDLEDGQYAAVYEYYKGLIAFRKAHGALRLSSAEDVAANVAPVEGLDANVVAFDIQGGINGETAKELFVIFNANADDTTVSLPEGKWNVYVNGEKAGTEVLDTVEGSAAVAPISAMVLVREGGAAGGGLSTAVIAGIVLLALAAIVVVAFVIKKNAKKHS
ncbi:MAG: type I pullulanase [Muribaculaceae bacterium]|nr:type I pullulanase [Roseburia sp.]MCM1431497.1 type I pullulanase [Muribaculaceae bacterium]MCM1493209.1 type I pullulanase [Muribaculaceae bacterium]